MAKSSKSSKSKAGKRGLAGKVKGFAKSPIGTALILEGVALGAIALTRSKRVRSAASKAGEKAALAGSAGRRAAAKSVKAAKTTAAKGVDKAAKRVKSLRRRAPEVPALETPVAAAVATTRRRKAEPKKMRSR